MKIKLYTLIAAAGIIAFLTSESNYSGGSPGAKTGSPGDGESTCIQCHSGSAVTIVENWITTNIPASGYVPGETYTITATGTHNSVGKFGFELTAEDNANAKTGNFIITNTTETKLANSNSSVTHKQAGTTPSGNSRSWSANWTAPATGNGDVTFYAAFNAANGTGSTSGDVIYKTSHIIIEDIISSVSETNNEIIKIYPNPFADHIIINSGDVEIREINILTTQGRLVYHQNDDFNQNEKLSLKELQPGVYHIVLRTMSNQKISKSIIKL